MMTTQLAVHAFHVHRPGVSLPVWRSDAWLNRHTPDQHLRLQVCQQPTQLDIFGELAS